MDLRELSKARAVMGTGVISALRARIFQPLTESDRLQAGILIGPTVLVFLVLSVLPISYGVWSSFNSGFVTNFEFVGIQNYVALSTSPDFWHSVEIGLIYAIYSVLIQVVFGVLIAVIVNEHFKFANIARTIVIIPYLIPTVAVALTMKWILHPQVGLLNYYLTEYGITATSVNFFSERLAMHAVVWISSWKFTAFVVLIVLARLQSIDKKYYELAESCGATTIRRFFDVTFPNIKNVVFLVILLRGIWMFNKFDMIWLLTQGGPFDVTTTMVIHAYNRAFGDLQFGSGAAITVIMFLLLAVNASIYFSVFNPEEEVET